LARVFVGLKPHANPKDEGRHSKAKDKSNGKSNGNSKSNGRSFDCVSRDETARDFAQDDEFNYEK
jgi:hypothetical protein